MTLRKPQLHKIDNPRNANLKGLDCRGLAQDYIVRVLGYEIRIPAGFEYDGTSIPQPLRWMLGGPYDHDLDTAGLVHDWLYYCQAAHSKIMGEWIRVELSRETADRILYELLCKDGVGWFRAHTIYRGVRIGAGSHWENDVNDIYFLNVLRVEIERRGQNLEYFAL